MEKLFITVEKIRGGYQIIDIKTKRKVGLPRIKNSNACAVIKSLERHLKLLKKEESK
jgi:hypothetical protein